MTAALALAAAMVAGAPPATVAALALALFRPGWLLVGAALGAGVGVRRRAGRDDDAGAMLFRAMAAELRAGATLRAALEAGAATVPGVDLRSARRVAQSGASMDEVAAELSTALPSDGRLAGAALRLVAGSGGRAASVLDQLAAQAASRAALAREQRALTAQARLSALLVGAGPALLGVVLLAGGRGRDLAAAGSLGLGVLGVGLALQIAGLIVVAAILRWAAP